MVKYTHGHHESVLRSHRWRNAENSAAYLLPDISPGARILDVGCGPGTITVDLARIVGPGGEVCGIDQADDAIAIARSTAQDAGLTNVRFAVGDVYAIDAADASFDVVHAHQVLQHLGDPVRALTEMRRVVTPGGVVAARDADYRAMAWYPRLRELDQWLDLYEVVTRNNGGEPDAGRKLLSWASEVGFAEVTPSASVWCFATPTDRDWWGQMWADRVVDSAFAEQAIEQGLATSHELTQIARAWQAWADSADGWFAIVHGEIRCRR